MWNLHAKCSVWLLIFWMVASSSVQDPGAVTNTDPPNVDVGYDSQKNISIAEVPYYSAPTDPRDHYYNDTDTKFLYNNILNSEFHPRDCSDLYKVGARRSGVYLIYVQDIKENFLVYCDMETDGGGWTVIQRRGNYGFPDNYFFRNWSDYKNGFGNLELEFWMGNDKISALTKQTDYDLNLEVRLVNGTFLQGTYGNISVANERELYKLSVDYYKSKDKHIWLGGLNNVRFSTRERDNDLVPNENLALNYMGGWWYEHKYFHANFNGMKSSDYKENKFTVYPNEHLIYSQIKIRPGNF